MQNEQSDSELITVAQMRAAEAEAIAAGTSGARLMERAGRAVADAVCSRSADALADIDAAPRALVLCGPGNNGGDGYVIARVLKDRGFAVDVCALLPTDRLTGDARVMAGLWDGPVHPPERLLRADNTPPPAVVIDALFGTGLTRALEGKAAEMVARANAMPGFKVAVDIPSGLDADTGEARGPVFDADLTVTFHAMKPGHVLHPGRIACGAVLVADIGLGAEATERARLTTDGPEIAVNDARRLLASLGRDPGGHKYTKGHTLVLAGGMEGIGAARLAARGALRAGVGLVTLGVPPSALMAHAARGPDALMLRRCDGEEGLAALLADSRRNAVVLGPAYGLGEATRDAVATVIVARRPAVLDADALTSFAGEAQGLAELTRAAGNTVITPHAGEFARIFSNPSEKASLETTKMLKLSRKLQHSAAAADPLLEAVHAVAAPLHKALAAAAFLGAVVVLKGPTTLIAAPDGRCAINTNAPPWLGTAGSGDVLAGLIGGLLSQGLSPFDAARAGVWLHGEAGNIAGRGLIADDLPEAVQTVWKAL